MDANNPSNNIHSVASIPIDGTALFSPCSSRGNASGSANDAAVSPSATLQQEDGAIADSSGSTVNEVNIIDLSSSQDSSPKDSFPAVTPSTNPKGRKKRQPAVFKERKAAKHKKPSTPQRKKGTSNLEKRTERKTKKSYITPNASKFLSWMRMNNVENFFPYPPMPGQTADEPIDAKNLDLKLQALQDSLTKKLKAAPKPITALLCPPVSKRRETRGSTSNSNPSPDLKTPAMALKFATQMPENDDPDFNSDDDASVASEPNDDGTSTVSSSGCTDSSEASEIESDSEPSDIESDAPSTEESTYASFPIPLSGTRLRRLIIEDLLVAYPGMVVHLAVPSSSYIFDMPSFQNEIQLLQQAGITCSYDYINKTEHKPKTFYVVPVVVSKVPEDLRQPKENQHSSSPFSVMETHKLIFNFLDLVTNSA